MKLASIPGTTSLDLEFERLGREGGLHVLV